MSKNQFNLENKIIKGSSQIAFSNIFSKIFAIFFVAIAGRVLGPYEYGKLATIISLGVIFSTIPATIFPQSLLWKLGSLNNNQSRGDVLVTSIFGTSVLFIFVLIIIILVPDISFYVSIIVFADCITYTFLNLQQGLLNYRQIVFFNIIRNIVKLVLLLYIWYEFPNHNWNYLDVLIILFLAPLLVIAFLEFWRSSNISFLSSKVDFSVLKELFNYGIYLSLSGIAVSVVLQADVIFLGHFHGEFVTGKYYAAKQLFVPIILFPAAFRGLIIPTISGKKLEYEDYKRLAIIILLLLSLVSFLSGFFGPNLITFVYGDEFRVSKSLTLIISSAAWFFSGRIIMESLILGRGDSYTPLIANLVTAVSGIFIYFYFISRSEIYGASQALLLTSIISFLAMLVAFKKSHLKNKL